MWRHLGRDLAGYLFTEQPPVITAGTFGMGQASARTPDEISPHPRSTHPEGYRGLDGAIGLVRCEYLYAASHEVGVWRTGRTGKEAESRRCRTHSSSKDAAELMPRFSSNVISLASSIDTGDGENGGKGGESGFRLPQRVTETVRNRRKGPATW